MMYSAGPSASPNLGGDSSINLREHSVEASEAAESCESSYFHHRLIGFIDEPFRTLNAGRPCYRARTRLQVSGEQASQLAAPHAEALGKFFDRRSILVESALLDNEPYCALDGCAASDPGIGKWRSLGATPQTRPKSRRFSSGGGRKELNVSRHCWANGADRSTIDTGGPDPGEKPAVIATITRDARTVTFCKIQRHQRRSYHTTGTLPERHQGMESHPGEQRSSALAIFYRETARRRDEGFRLAMTQIVDVDAASLECTSLYSGSSEVRTAIDHTFEIPITVVPREDRTKTVTHPRLISRGSHHQGSLS